MFRSYEEYYLFSHTASEYFNIYGFSSAFPAAFNGKCTKHTDACHTQCFTSTQFNKGFFPFETVDFDATGSVDVPV